MEAGWKLVGSWLEAGWKLVGSGLEAGWKRVGSWLEAAITFIYSAGLRVSEAVSLKITDIEFDRGLIRIVQGKGKKDRIVPLSERLYAMIPEYRKEYQPKTWLFEG